MEEMTYTGRKSISRGGREHSTAVTVRARPCNGPSEVVLSTAALESLRRAFGPDFEYQRHNVWAAVATQIAVVNVAGHCPHADPASAWFRAEVVAVEVSGDVDRKTFGSLLSVAGMDAIAGFLAAWEDTQEAALGRS